jgi:hypothetical protein
MINSPLSIGDGDGNSTFEADGTLVFAGNGTVWADSAVQATGLARGSSGPVDTKISIDGTDFYLPGYDGVNQVTSAYGSLSIASEYKEGSNRYTHIYWMPTTDDAGNVTWFLSVSLFDPVTGTHTTPTMVNTTGAALGTGRVVESMFPAINGTGIKIGMQLVFKIWRDPSAVTDTYEHDAVITTIGSYYEVDTVGSRTMQTK